MGENLLKKALYFSTREIPKEITTYRSRGVPPSPSSKATYLLISEFSGYARELNYRRDDMSFSAWKHRPGSTWFV